MTWGLRRCRRSGSHGTAGLVRLDRAGGRYESARERETARSHAAIAETKIQAPPSGEEGGRRPPVIETHGPVGPWWPRSSCFWLRFPSTFVGFEVDSVERRHQVTD